MSILNAAVCSFKRTFDSANEKGLLINEGQLIIDMKGKTVPSPIYSFQNLCHHGALLLKED